MSPNKKAANLVFPGDKLAVSEEFLPGRHAYDDSGVIKSLAVGSVMKNMKNMEISVNPMTEAEIIKPGDWITGQVETTQTNAAFVKIHFLNGEQSHKDFSGSLSLRSHSPGRGAPRGGPRPGPPVKLGDIVRCRVFSLVNGIIHLSVEEDEMGVLYALCGNCGKPMTRGGSRAKCDECGNVEQRKLASDFGQWPIRP
ncbi:MAG: exosome complex RNA-binding protein Csl4 [Thaumarchaeota archaeon]|nr:exosome complex RNA-binding protein Csl4 [Nitrososphaerota archaeon]